MAVSFEIKIYMKFKLHCKHEKYISITRNLEEYVKHRIIYITFSFQNSSHKKKKKKKKKK